jgi:hypothetical protein
VISGENSGPGTVVYIPTADPDKPMMLSTSGATEECPECRAAVIKYFHTGILDPVCSRTGCKRTIANLVTPNVGHQQPLVIAFRHHRRPGRRPSANSDHHAPCENSEGGTAKWHPPSNAIARWRWMSRSHSPFPGIQRRRTVIIVRSPTLSPGGVLRIGIKNENVESVRRELVQERVDCFELRVVRVQCPEPIAFVPDRQKMRAVFKDELVWVPDIDAQSPVGEWRRIYNAAKRSAYPGSADHYGW